MKKKTIQRFFTMLALSLTVGSLAVPAAAQEVQNEQILDGTTDEVQGDIMLLDETDMSQPVGAEVEEAVNASEEAAPQESEQKTEQNTEQNMESNLEQNAAAADVEGEIQEDVEGEIQEDLTGEIETGADAAASNGTGVNQDDHVEIKSDDKPYLALGENLSAQQKATVLALMGIDASKLSDYNVVSITNAEEHAYLDEYLPKEKIGTRALSSVVIVKREKGSGLNISTKNINYCTVGMYKNALATAGLQDADIIVAGPTPISGTAALIGAMKAYSEITGEAVDEESLDAAMNEIVVTGELADLIEGADDGEVEEFIAYVKQKVLEGGLKSENSIRTCIKEALDKYNFTMTDAEQNQLTSVLMKISKLDIDVDALVDQAKSLYDKIKQSEEAQSFLAKIFAALKSFLQSIFG